MVGGKAEAGSSSRDTRSSAGAVLCSAIVRPFFRNCVRTIPAYDGGMVLNPTDFKAITASALKLFDERVATVDPDICWEFDIEVARLESQVVQLYGIAALMARRESEMEKTAEIWAAMIAACDSVAEKIQTLCVAHPFCMASHDKILDIRNKAARLRNLHS
jgi:hypothetical protein